MTSSLDEIVEIFKRSIHRDLDDWDSAQLEEVLNDQTKLDQLITNQSQALKTLNELGNDRLRLGKMFAESNLSMRPKFDELRTRLETSRAEVRELDERVKQMKREVDSISDTRSLSNVTIVMNVAIRKAEENSESLYDKYANGDMSVEEFVTKFMDSRQVYHTRKLKYDKLVEILRHQQYR